MSRRLHGTGPLPKLRQLSIRRLVMDPDSPGPEVQDLSVVVPIVRAHTRPWFWEGHHQLGLPFGGGQNEIHLAAEMGATVWPAPFKARRALI